MQARLEPNEAPIGDDAAEPETWRILDPAETAAHYKKMYDRASSLARIGVWECDLLTDVLSWTDGVYDLFGFPRGSVVSREASVACYAPDSRAEMERLRAAAIASGTGFTMDARIVAGDGTPRWIRLTAEIESEDGRPVRIFGTKQDISAQKAAEAQVAALQAELLHVSRLSAMGTMAVTLAHEFNQPLTAIANYMAAARRMAASEGVSAALAGCIAGAGDGALRAGEIIKRLRAATGRVERRTERVAVETLVREAIALAAVPANVSWQFDLDAAEVVADRAQLQQVLLALIRNACEAADGEPLTIAIATKRRGDLVELRVSDDGPGISTRLINDLFDASTTTKPHGIGIGLSVARTIIEAHGGHIAAGNCPEGGAEVWFTLPVRLCRL